MKISILASWLFLLFEMPGWELRAGSPRRTPDPGDRLMPAQLDLNDVPHAVDSGEAQENRRLVVAINIASKALEAREQENELIRQWALTETRRADQAEGGLRAWKRTACGLAILAVPWFGSRLFRLPRLPTRKHP